MALADWGLLQHGHVFMYVAYNECRMALAFLETVFVFCTQYTCIYVCRMLTYLSL